ATSNIDMSWDSARNFCAALELPVATRADIYDAWDGVGTITADTCTQSGRCSAIGSTDANVYRWFELAPSDSASAYYARNNEAPSSHARVNQHRALCTPYNQTTRELDRCSVHDDCAESEDGKICMNGMCAECSQEQFWNSKKCVSCPTGTGYGCTYVSQADRCLGTGFYGYIASCGNGAMVSCDRTEIIRTMGADSITSCKACPNRCFNTADNTCRVSGEDYLKNEDGTCYCNPREDTYAYESYCLYRPEGTYLDSYHVNIKSCTTELGYCTNLDNADRCLGTGFYASSNVCTAAMAACDKTDESLGTQGGQGATSCKACPNRCFNTADNKCYLYGIGKTYVVKTAEGLCVKYAQTTCDCFDGSCAQNACTQVDYLESTGSQYIRLITGEVDSTYGLKMTYSMTAVSDNYPAGFSTTNNRRFLFFGARQNYGWVYGWSSYSTSKTSPSFPFSTYPDGLDNYYTATLNYLNNKKCSFGSDTLYDISGASHTFTNTDFLLFKSYSSAVKSRIKSAVLTKGSEIIMNLIPVKDSYGKPAMYDKVSQTLFYNQGSGEFVTP
ncbi:MAG: hypothetical protein J6Y85_04840, partial [Alphaproteobacteria bacterium]|nr:hypothetical protein [Alphaproteobacteria bacterium]